MKYFCFELTDELCKQAFQPIRKKEDVISLVLNTIKVLITMPIIEESSFKSKNRIILFVDKMSRLFFCNENKIFTINFPFYVTKSDVSELLIIKHRHVEIDSYISSLIISILSEDKALSIPFDYMKEFVFQHMIENDWEGLELDDVCEIIKKLVIFETGYLRYDHDEKHSNGLLHPEYHIDFCYDSNNEVKIGIEDSVDYNWMIDFANVNTNCRFLK